MQVQRIRYGLQAGTGIRCGGEVVVKHRLRFDPNPSWRRVVIIGLLLFFEAVLINLLTVLQAGRWPTPVETATFVTVGLIQLVNYFLGFLRKEE